MGEIKIDPEFQTLIPPLIAEEQAGLEASILAEGCRDAIVIWDSTIVDGHRRYDICTRHGIEFKTVEHVFKNRSEAKDWIIDNQLARRNLTLYQRSVLALQKEPLIAAKAKEKQIEHGGTAPGKPKTLPQSFGEVSSKERETNVKVAKVAGVSHATVAKVKAIEARAPEEVKEQARSGVMSINEAYKEVKEIERKEQRKESVAPPPMPDGLFDVLYADPPWEYDKGSVDEGRKIEQKYPSMKLDDIKALKIPAADNSVLFLWSTAPKLEEALEVMNAWGYKYRTCAIWDKMKLGLGHWFRCQHELILVGMRGKFPAPPDKQLARSVFRIERGEHSKKPEEIRDLISGWYENYRKVELFARVKIKGWEAWGNEV